MAIGLHNLKPAQGAVRKKKRLGLGPGSGQGKTAGRGHKGQKSRSGYSMKIGFEGGQMPLQRRLPKRGFTNVFKKQWAEVNLDVLEKRFAAGEAVTPQVLRERGIIKKVLDGVVILGRGQLTKPLTVTAHRFSASAKEKIVAAGGTAEEINPKS
jgi:large subunit ribosomal protein L15